MKPKHKPKKTSSKPPRKLPSQSIPDPAHLKHQYDKSTGMYRGN